MFEKIKQFLFYNTSARQTVAKNTFWLTVANFGGRMFRAIIIIYAARVLGATEWGVFNYAITLAAFLTLFTDLGISNILTRETARHSDPEHRLKILSTSLVLKLCLLTLAVLVMLFAAPHLTKIEAAKALFPIVAFILVFDTLREFGFAYLRAVEQMEWEALISVGMNVAIVAAGFTFLAMHTTVKSFTMAYAVGTGIGMFATAILLRKHLKNIWNNFNPSMMGFILKSSWPFAVSGVMGMLTLNTDVIVIGWMQSATQLGYYSAGQRLIQLMYLLPTIISISVLPTFARVANRDDKKFRAIFEGLVSFMFLVAIPIVVGGVIIGTPLLSLVFGSSYTPGALSFKILLITLLIDFPAVVLSSAIFAYDRQKNLILYSAIAGVLNLCFDLLFIPRFGIAGSSLATVLAQLIANIYLWRTLRRINDFRILRHLKKVILSALIMGVVTFALFSTGLNVIVVVAISIPVYFASLYFLREKLLLEISTTLRPAVSTVPGVGESAAATIREETNKHIESD
jgi:O-antigen/teichoic acid export membrane protein